MKLDIPITKYTNIALEDIVIAGIDVDIGKGAAVVVCKGDVVKKQLFIPGVKGIPNTFRIKHLCDKIVNYLLSKARKELIPNFVGLEVEAIEAKGQYKTLKSRLVGCLLLKLVEAGFSVCEYAPMSIKAFAVSGKAKKEDMIKAVKDIWEYEFLDHNLKPQDDLTDAFVVSQFLLNQVGILFLNDKTYSYITDKQKKTIHNAIKSAQIYSL
jgi:Holliday junction resolvasome RuvABC endonuclease subunit